MGAASMGIISSLVVVEVQITGMNRGDEDLEKAAKDDITAA